MLVWSSVPIHIQIYSLHFFLLAHMVFIAFKFMNKRYICIAYIQYVYKLWAHIMQSRHFGMDTFSRKNLVCTNTYLLCTSGLYPTRRIYAPTRNTLPTSSSSLYDARLATKNASSIIHSQYKIRLNNDHNIQWWWLEIETFCCRYIL